MSNKAFYIISSLSKDVSFDRLNRAQRYETEEEAAQVAEKLIRGRERNGLSPMEFFVLKTVVRVGRAYPPIETVKLE